MPMDTTILKVVTLLQPSILAFSLEGLGPQAIALSALAVVALSMLLLVTGGIVYLTAVEWRDRRRRDRDSA